MGRVVGDLLPLAGMVAISRVPIIAVVLMLLAPKAGSTCAGFLAGWIVGIAGVTTVVLLLTGAPEPGGSSSRSSVAATWVQLVLGVLLVPMAAWQWRSRPKPDEEPGLPTWIAAIDRFTPARAGELGLALAEVNPKNLLVCVAAGRSGAQTTWLVVAFGDRGQHRGGASARLRGGPQALAGALASLRGWLTAHSACVAATLLLVIGVVLIGQGLGGLG